MPQTILTFLAADTSRNYKQFSLKMLHCEARPFPVGAAYGYLANKSAIFYSVENTHAYMNLDHVTSSRFVLARDVHCEFDYWPSAVSMPPTKVYPQCKAAVPVRWKTCKCCDHVFRSKQKAECNLREKAMKHMRAVVSDSVKSARLKIRLNITCTRPVKERQKFVSELCIGRRMASMRESQGNDRF